MSTSSKNVWISDPWGQIGRGLVLILALTMPFFGRLDSIPLSTGGVLPAVSLLGLIIPLMAIASVATGGAYKLYGRWVLPVAIAAGLLAGSGSLAHGKDPILAIATLWEPILLVTGVAILFSGYPTERLGLLATLIFSTLFATFIGFGELFRMPGVESFAQIFHDAPESWQLLIRLTGPLKHAEALSWLTAAMIPLLAGAALTVTGKKREILLLLIGILWLATLLTLSFGAPIAALAGVLVIMAGRAGERGSMAGLSIPLLLGVLLALFNPAFRARWGPHEEPIGFTVQALTTIEAANEDSLLITLVNPGPVAWDETFETGYHILYPESLSEREPIRLLRGGWVSKSINQNVAPGEQVTVTLPFRSYEETGFLVLDLKGPGGLVSQYGGPPYLLMFQSDFPGEHNRLGRVINVKSEKYIRAANVALQRGSTQLLPDLVEVWRDVYALLGARPWFGLGPGATESLLGYNSRNLFLEITVAGGWIGLGVFIIMILGLNVGLLVRDSLEAIVMSGVLFTAVLHGMFAYALDDPSVRATVMLLLGVAWAIAFEPRDSELEPEDIDQHSPRRHPLWKINRK